MGRNIDARLARLEAGVARGPACIHIIELWGGGYRVTGTNRVFESLEQAQAVYPARNYFISPEQAPSVEEWSVRAMEHHKSSHQQQKESE